MTIDSGTAGAAVILFVVTSAVILGILYIIKPVSLVHPDTQKFKFWKTLGISTAFSFMFAFIVAHISYQVDKQFARKQLLLAKVGDAK